MCLEVLTDRQQTDRHIKGKDDFVVRLLVRVLLFPIGVQNLKNNLQVCAIARLKSVIR